MQFLSPDGALVKEAMKTAASVTIDGVPTRIFQFEYALAIKAGANRKKDWKHIVTALDSGDPDVPRLESILKNTIYWRDGDCISMTESMPVSNEDIYKAKSARRKTLAKEPFESKIQAMVRLQHINLSMKKASGRLHLAFRPWDMSEDQYQRYIDG